MRRNDRNAGSIKALVILALLAANIVVALPRHTSSSPSRRSDKETPHFVGRMHQAASVEEAVHP